ncbi:MAG: hypothetical protein ACE5KX_02535 [Acidimicrobiia bacterium]
MTILWNGEVARVGGWYIDDHGHQLFMRRGDPAPVCPHFLPAAVHWRLVKEIGDISPRR